MKILKILICSLIALFLVGDTLWTYYHTYDRTKFDLVKGQVTNISVNRNNAKEFTIQYSYQGINYTKVLDQSQVEQKIGSRSKRRGVSDGNYGRVLFPDLGDTVHLAVLKNSAGILDDKVVQLIPITFYIMLIVPLFCLGAIIFASIKTFRLDR